MASPASLPLIWLAYIPLAGSMPTRDATFTTSAIGQPPLHGVEASLLLRFLQLLEGLGLQISTCAPAHPGAGLGITGKLELGWHRAEHIGQQQIHRILPIGRIVDRLAAGLQDFELAIGVEAEA